MARDSNLAKRDLFVIPGGLLGTFGLLGLLYVLFVRSESGVCQSSYRFLVSGACYNVLPLFLVILLLGLALFLVGILVFRGNATGLESHLHAGTPTHFFLALLLSLAVVPAVVALILRYVEQANNTLFVTALGATSIKTVALLGVLAVVGTLMLVPYAILLGRQAARRRRFLAEARRVSPSPPGAPVPEPQPETPVVDEADWPESR